MLCCAVQHPPVYTMGAGSSEDHVKFDLQHPPHPLYRTERGGEVTFHGPGQVRGAVVLDGLTKGQVQACWLQHKVQAVHMRWLRVA